MAITQVREALRLITAGLWPAHAQALRLAALRRYLRFQNVELRDIHAHWAWTPRETINHLNEEPARTLMQRARAAQVAFAETNRGYALAISPVRSLARQVELWNGNSGVRTAAVTLKTEMLRELEKPEYVSPPEQVHIAAFRTALQRATINPEPGNAAPGLSGHGQMRAVDFVVMQGARVIATTEVASAEAVWRRQGWADRLATVARQAGLRGPLIVPDEPWHWVLP